MFDSPDAFWKEHFFGDTFSDLDAAAEEDSPSHPQDFTKEGLDAKEVVLCLSKSIVSLVSSVGNFTDFQLYNIALALCFQSSNLCVIFFNSLLLHIPTDGVPLFGCTGTVVNHVGSETWILTSATLIRKPGTDHDAYNEDEVKVRIATLQQSP